MAKKHGKSGDTIPISGNPGTPYLFRVDWKAKSAKSGGNPGTPYLFRVDWKGERCASSSKIVDESSASVVASWESALR